jgi:hypothetical protein
MQLDLTDEERDALAKYLRAGIDADRFPLSPRLRPIKAVLAKLDPPKPKTVLPEIPSAPKRGKTKARR